MEIHEAWLNEGSVTDIVNIGKNRWQLTKQFVFYVFTDRGLRIYKVPNGFICDLASIPCNFDWLFGKKTIERMFPAYVLHDYMYDKVEFTDRKYADDIMLKLMDKHQEPKETWKRNLIYTAVRAFGWAGFRG
jgi:hypothetical protein